ncbi:MAG: helix-turn-helix transcriptional regulator [Chloroflexi bacterium]|nr:helix-turn-helix transcriptional regulator [Chloroflexota bacterium]
MDASTNDSETPGRRLERYMKSLFRRDGVKDVTDLAKKAGISRDTPYNWWTGETVPRSGEMVKVARELNVPVDHLWAAYEGRPIAPEISADLLDAIEDRMRRAFREELRAVLDELRGSGPGPEGAP